MKTLKKSNQTVDNYLRHKRSEAQDNYTLFNPTPEDYTAIYARISGTNDSFSIPSQIESCKKFAEDNNLFVYNIYKDKRSARKIHFYERPNFKRLINDMETGVFKNIIIIRRDRLSRRIDDFMHLKRIFINHNVKVHYVKEDNFNFDSDSYITNFLENIMMSISTLEPENIYRRTKGGRQELRKKGKFISGKAPIGYIKVKNEKLKFEIEEPEAHLIREIFRYYREHIMEGNKTRKNLIDYFGSSDILKSLKRPKSINYNLLERLITRPIYGGKLIISEDDEINDCVKWDKIDGRYLLDESKFIKCSNFGPIIEWDDWKDVFLYYYLEKNGPLKKAYLFGSILYCKNCEDPLVLEEDFYKCNNGCFSVHIDKMVSKITKNIINKIESRHLKDILLEKIAIVKQGIAKENKILSSKRKILRKNIDSYINSNDENKEKKIEILQKEIDLVRDNLNSLGSQKVHLQNILNNIELFRTQLAESQYLTAKAIKESWQFYDNLISKFVSKVVCSVGNDGKFRIKIKYKK